MAPKQFEVFAELGIDAQAAFDLLTAPEGMRQWIPGCRSVRIESPDGGPTLMVGSVRHVTMSNGTTAIEKVVHLQMPWQLDYILVSTGMPAMDRGMRDYRGQVRLTPRANGGCELSWAIHFRCVGPMRLLQWPLRKGLHATMRGMTADICRLSSGRLL